MRIPKSERATADAGATNARAQATMGEPPIITITADRGLGVSLRELWEYRELLYFLAWRDVKIRYKQTVIGVAWAVIQPVITMVVFTVIFDRFARIPSEGIPYPIFALAGLLPWYLFSGALQRSVQSVVASAHLIAKVYFPRLIVPIAASLSAVVDFAFSLVVLVAMAIGFGILPTWRFIAVPALVIFVLLSALAVGLWLSALNVRYRDVGYALPFLIQLWMFASPVVYPLGLVSGRWRLLYSLNPTVGIIEGFRWAFFGGRIPAGEVMLVAGVVVLCLLTGGVVYFRRMERTFADVI